MNIATIRLMSRKLFMPTDITVLFPETLPEAQAELPAVWLLHGACGDHRTYLGQVDFASILEAHNCFIIMPSALNSDYGNYAQFGTGYCFRDYFFEELMPFIASTFPVSSRREENYILGASMGGFGAMGLGLYQPERFQVIGMLGASLRESAFLEPYIGRPMAEFREAALANPTAFPTEYGSKDMGIKRKEVNVIAKYSTIQAFFDSWECMWRRFPEVARRGTLPEIYAACGSEDLFYPANCRFLELARKLGVADKVTAYLPEGIGHAETFFTQQIQAFFDRYEV